MKCNYVFPNGSVPTVKFHAVGMNSIDYIVSSFGYLITRNFYKSYNEVNSMEVINYVES